MKKIVLGILIGLIASVSFAVLAMKTASKPQMPSQNATWSCPAGQAITGLQGAIVNTNNRYLWVTGIVCGVKK